MIQMQTWLDVADNTGAKLVQCIKVLGGTHRRYASLGDIVVVSVKKSLPTSEFRQGAVARIDTVLHERKLGVRGAASR